MSYFARLAQRSAISPLRPVAQQPAAPISLEQHVQTVAPPPASQTQASAMSEAAAPVQIAESPRSEAGAPASVTRSVERPPPPGMAPPVPEAGHDLLAKRGAVDVIESFVETVSNVRANARLPEPGERPRAAVGAIAAEHPVRREPDDARYSPEAPAAGPRAHDERRARSTTQPSRVVAPSEDRPTEGLPQYRDDTRGTPQLPSDEARPPIRRPPPRPSLEQTTIRDAAARRTDNGIEIHIGRISLQVSTPQPAAPAPVPLRESFAPHRHYLRLR
jgi:hypothetical protein